MSTSSRRAKAPSYRHHKPSGQAFVQLKCRRFYLGKHGTPASREAYNRFLAEHWAPPDDPGPPAEVRSDLTIVELIDRYWTYAQEHYRKHSEATGTAEGQRPVLKRLREKFGTTRAAVFGPRALKSLRQTWRNDDLAIKTINSYTATVKGVFKWAVSEELLPVAVHAALATVRGLSRGRDQAREPAPIGPVDDDDVEATLPHLPPIVSDLVRIQRLTGCRPGEARIMRPCDVQRFTASDRPLPLFAAADRELPAPRELDVWEYRPSKHKTEHRGGRRIILIGPRAQEILRPYLLRLAFAPSTSYVFGTARGGCYSKDRYVREVARACEAAFKMPAELRERALRTAKQLVAAGELAAAELDARRRAAAAWRATHCWAPNQLRHAAGTEIRQRFDLDGSRTVLGHKHASTTETYAERDLAKARAIMREVG